MSAEAELIDEIARFTRDPLGFVKYAFPWLEQGELADHPGPRFWQADILTDIRNHLRSVKRFQPLQLAVASGHGIGKSALIAMIVNWAMSTCEDCKVIVTANTGTQLETKTWPEVMKWFRLAINSHWWDVKATSISVRDKGHEKSWRADAITWSENNTEAFAGAHNAGKRIVVIYDEASAIADKLWEVTQGALTDENTEIIWIAFGNPTQNSGSFRECFGRMKHRWVTRQIDSRTVEGTNKAQFDAWVHDYGEDSDFVRVRVRGEFPRVGSTQFISGEDVANARKRDVGDQSGAYSVMAVDVARFGDDQTVIGVRRGLKFTIIEKLRSLDTIQVGQRVIYHAKQLEPRAIVIDGDGLGAGVVDYVKFHLTDWMKVRDYFRFREFHGGNTPSDAEMYYNARAEVWGLMRNWLETGAIDDDAELDSDLTGPKYFFSSKSQIQLERKEDMKKRGLASPDSGDTLAMTFAVNPQRQTLQEATTIKIQTAYDEMGATQANLVRLKLEAERKKQTRYRRNG